MATVNNNNQFQARTFQTANEAVSFLNQVMRMSLKAGEGIKAGAGERGYVGLIKGLPVKLATHWTESPDNNVNLACAALRESLKNATDLLLGKIEIDESQIFDNKKLKDIQRKVNNLNTKLGEVRKNVNDILAGNSTAKLRDKTTKDQLNKLFTRANAFEVVKLIQEALTGKVDAGKIDPVKDNNGKSYTEGISSQIWLIHDAAEHFNTSAVGGDTIKHSYFDALQTSLSTKSEQITTFANKVDGYLKARFKDRFSDSVFASIKDRLTKAFVISGDEAGIISDKGKLTFVESKKNSKSPNRFVTTLFSRDDAETTLDDEMRNLIRYSGQSGESFAKALARLYYKVEIENNRDWELNDDTNVRESPSCKITPSERFEPVEMGSADTNFSSETQHVFEMLKNNVTIFPPTQDKEGNKIYSTYQSWLFDRMSTELKKSVKDLTLEEMIKFLVDHQNVKIDAKDRIEVHGWVCSSDSNDTPINMMLSNIHLKKDSLKKDGFIHKMLKGGLHYEDLGEKQKRNWEAKIKGLNEKLDQMKNANWGKQIFIEINKNKDDQHRIESAADLKWDKWLNLINNADGKLKPAFAELLKDTEYKDIKGLRTELDKWKAVDDINQSSGGKIDSFLCNDLKALLTVKGARNENGDETNTIFFQGGGLCAINKGSFEYKGQKLTSCVTPKRKFANPKPYSMPANLALTELTVDDKGKQVTLFKGLRFGSYNTGVSGSQKGYDYNLHQSHYGQIIEQMVLENANLMEQAEKLPDNGELVVPVFRMDMADQPELLFCADTYEMEINGKPVKVKPQLCHFRIPTDSATLVTTGPNKREWRALSKAEVEQNDKALDNLIKIAGGSTDSQVQKLCEQVQEYWSELKKQMCDDHGLVLFRGYGAEMMQFGARLALIASKCGHVPAFNCNGGRDRTGLMDTECKALAAYLAANPEKDKLPKIVNYAQYSDNNRETEEETYVELPNDPMRELRKDMRDKSGNQSIARQISMNDHDMLTQQVKGIRGRYKFYNKSPALPDIHKRDDYEEGVKLKDKPSPAVSLLDSGLRYMCWDEKKSDIL